MIGIIILDDIKTPKPQTESKKAGEVTSLEDKALVKQDNNQKTLKKYKDDDQTEWTTKEARSGRKQSNQMLSCPHITLN